MISEPDILISIADERLRTTMLVFWLVAIVSMTVVIIPTVLGSKFLRLLFSAIFIVACSGSIFLSAYYLCLT